MSKPWRIVPGAGCNPAVTDFTSLPHMLKRQSLLSTFLFTNTPTRTIRHSLASSSISLPNLPIFLAPCLLHCKLHWLFSFHVHTQTQLNLVSRALLYSIPGAKEDEQEKAQRSFKAPYAPSLATPVWQAVILLGRRDDFRGRAHTKGKEGSVPRYRHILTPQATHLLRNMLQHCIDWESENLLLSRNGCVAMKDELGADKKGQVSQLKYIMRDHERSFPLKQVA